MLSYDEDWRGKIMIKTNNDISNIQWCHPMGLKELSQIFDIHRNTMSKWLKNQTVRNRQLSPRKWEVAVFELPYDLTSDNPEMSYHNNSDDYF